MKLMPHLTFDGNCKDVFEFHKDLLGGSLTTTTREGEKKIPSKRATRPQATELTPNLIGLRPTGIFYFSSTLTRGQVTEFQGQTDSGAFYSIAIPENWSAENGLVIWNHGYQGYLMTAPKPIPPWGRCKTSCLHRAMPWRLPATIKQVGPYLTPLVIINNSWKNLSNWQLSRIKYSSRRHCQYSRSGSWPDS